MRLRNDPKARKLLLDHQNVYIDYDMEIKPTVDWSKVFGNTHSLYLEIGMGKGQFIIQHALNHPEYNFIGLEINEVICAKALKKFLVLESKPKNLRFIKFNAKHLNLLFTPFSISGIYLNFSDPWPKKRHAKNRLTSPTFLSIYQHILKSNAVIEFKSDNDGLYQYTLDTLNSNQNIAILYYTSDLYANLDAQWNINNVATEYEQKFSPLKNINKIIFQYHLK